MELDTLNSYSPMLRLALWRIIREEHIKFLKLHSVTTSNCIYVSLSKFSIGNILNYKNYNRISKIVNWFLFLLLVISFCVEVEGCGPGRGNGRRTSRRKLLPLAYKQYVPNVPEYALSASGLSEGPIHRESNKFKELVPNYNPDILFRDDEGTGADQLMTKRLREKLNTLAISVMTQWPGVKLRVIEGWDEDKLHPPKSLHYEGRAIDIQTSDKDWAKYGMLARLAVEAGFDWVYYESRSHIHCSVKSDAFRGGRLGGCFNSNSTVETYRGKIQITELEIGDYVKSIDDSGEIVFSQVILYLDRNQSEIREFYEIQTMSSTIRLTPSHLLYTIPQQLQISKEHGYDERNDYQWNGITNEIHSLIINENDLNITISNEDLLEMAYVTFARNIGIGDRVLILDNVTNTLRLDVVINVNSIIEEGVYAPLTTNGRLFVDNILSSSYAVIQSQNLAHWSFLPIRFLHNFITGINHVWNQLNFLISLSTSPINGNDKSKDLIVQKIASHFDNNHSKIKSKTINYEGVFWYASFLYKLTNHLLPSSLIYQS